MPLGGADETPAITFEIGIRVRCSPQAKAGADGFAKGVDSFQDPSGAEVRNCSRQGGLVSEERSRPSDHDQGDKREQHETQNLRRRSPSQ